MAAQGSSSSHSSSKDEDETRCSAAQRVFESCTEDLALHHFELSDKAALDRDNHDLSYRLESKVYPHVYFPRNDGPAGNPLNCSLLRVTARSEIPAAAAEVAATGSRDRYGTFPEIQRAWVCCDNKFCLWNYTTGTVDIRLPDCASSITAVALCVPQPLAFRDGHVRYVLAIATTTSVSIRAIRMPDGARGVLDIPRGSDYKCSLKGALVDRIAGDLHGRVFLGTGTGGLTELMYGDVPAEAASSDKGIEQYLQQLRRATTAAIELAAEACGRQRKRCRTINHTNLLSWNPYTVIRNIARVFDPDPLVDMVVDHNRSHLYTLGVSGTITTYLLGGPSDLPVVGCRLTQSGLREQAKVHSRDMGGRGAAAVAMDLLSNSLGAGAGGATGLGFPLVRLQPVHPDVSKRVHLVAMDEGGARLYFSMYDRPKRGYGSIFDDTRTADYVEQSGQSSGKNIELVYVRLPPPSNLSVTDGRGSGSSSAAAAASSSSSSASSAQAQMVGRRQDEADLTALYADGPQPRQGDAHSMQSVVACCMVPGSTVLLARRKEGRCETVGITYEPMLRGRRALEQFQKQAKTEDGAFMRGHENSMREAVTRRLLPLAGAGWADHDDDAEAAGLGMDIRAMDAEPQPSLLYHDMHYSATGALLVGPGPEPAPIAPDAAIPVVLEAAARDRAAVEEEDDGLPDDGAFVEADGRRRGGDGWDAAGLVAADGRGQLPGPRIGRKRGRGRGGGPANTSAAAYESMLSMQDQALLESFPQLRPGRLLDEYLMVLKRRARELKAYPEDAHLGEHKCPRPMWVQAQPVPRQRFVCVGPDGVALLEQWRPVDLLAENVLPRPARHVALMQRAFSPAELASMCLQVFAGGSAVSQAAATGMRGDGRMSGGGAAGRNTGAAARLLLGMGGMGALDTPDETLAHAASDAFDRVGEKPSRNLEGYSEQDLADLFNTTDTHDFMRGLCETLSPSTALQGVFLYYQRTIDSIYKRSLLVWEGGDWPEDQDIVETYNVGQPSARPLPVFVRYSEAELEEIASQLHRLKVFLREKFPRVDTELMRVQGMVRRGGTDRERALSQLKDPQRHEQYLLSGLFAHVDLVLQGICAVARLARPTTKLGSLLANLPAECFREPSTDAGCVQTLRLQYITQKPRSQMVLRRILSSLALRGMAAGMGHAGALGGMGGGSAERSLVQEIRSKAPFFMRASDAELTSAQLLLQEAGEAADRAQKDRARELALRAARSAIDGSRISRELLQRVAELCLVAEEISDYGFVFAVCAHAAAKQAPRGLTAAAALQRARQMHRRAAESATGFKGDEAPGRPSPDGLPDEDEARSRFPAWVPVLSGTEGGGSGRARDAGEEALWLHIECARIARRALARAQRPESAQEVVLFAHELAARQRITFAQAAERAGHAIDGERQAAALESHRAAQAVLLQAYLEASPSPVWKEEAFRWAFGFLADAQLMYAEKAVESAVQDCGLVGKGPATGAGAKDPPVVGEIGAAPVPHGITRVTVEAMVDWTDPLVFRHSSMRRALEVTSPRGLLPFLRDVMQSPAAVLGVYREQRRYAETARLLASLAMRAVLPPPEETESLEGGVGGGAGAGARQEHFLGDGAEAAPIVRRTAMLREASRLASEPSVRATDAAGAAELNAIRRDAELARVQCDMLRAIEARGGRDGATKQLLEDLAARPPSLDWLLPEAQRDENRLHVHALRLLRVAGLARPQQVFQLVAKAVDLQITAVRGQRREVAQDEIAALLVQLGSVVALHDSILQGVCLACENEAVDWGQDPGFNPGWIIDGVLGRIRDVDESGEGAGMLLGGAGAGAGAGAGEAFGPDGVAGTGSGIRWRRRLGLYSRMLQEDGGDAGMRLHVVRAYCEGVCRWVRFARRPGAGEEDVGDLLRGANQALMELTDKAAVLAALPEEELAEGEKEDAQDLERRAREDVMGFVAQHGASQWAGQGAGGIGMGASGLGAASSSSASAAARGGMGASGLGW